MRRAGFIVFFWLAALVNLPAAGTNYFCVDCGKGPLTGRIWMTKWGPICNDCYQLPNHCSLCGLPIRPQDGAVQTGDGRLICKFCKPHAVLEEAQAAEIFAGARRGLIELFGRGLALRYPSVKVKLFDVAYWSDQGRPDGLHAFGFASSRRAANGDFTHEVVLLSGRLRSEIEATAAHEYTHLWIHENLPPDHSVDPDVIEGICELSAYQLMRARHDTNQMQRILENPYTHGEIKKLVALDRERGPGWIFRWVKNGATANPDVAARAGPVAKPGVTAVLLPRPLPAALRLEGLLLAGEKRLAIICGETFAAGETESVKLRNRTVMVHCVRIGADSVTVKLDGQPDEITFTMGAKN
jgi:hypothetical protein